MYVTSYAFNLNVINPKRNEQKRFLVLKWQVDNRDNMFSTIIEKSSARLSP